MRRVVTVCVCVVVVVAEVVVADMCDRRDRRHDRRWKGDVGALNAFPGATLRDRLQVHHRVRRFLSFPTGSVLTVTPTLTIPYLDELDGYLTSAQVYAFPFDLELPNGTLQFRTRDEDDPMTYATYSSSMSRLGRALDHQRVAGFTFLQGLMDTAGVEGRACVLRAVCEVAEQPVEHLGLTGELINLFFSAGYGGGSEAVEEYVAAEEAGRRQGQCQDLYPACPFHMADLAQSALAFFHHGLASVGSTPAGTLLS